MELETVMRLWVQEQSEIWASDYVEWIGQLIEDQKIEHLADGAEGGGDENGENLGVGKALFNPEV